MLTDGQVREYLNVWERRERRLDTRVSRQMALVANIHRDHEKRPFPYPDDYFVPKTKTEIEDARRRAMKASQKAMEALSKLNQ